MAENPVEAEAGPLFENERQEVLGLAKDPVLRRAWPLYLAQKSLPFDQAIEWARAAEQFITDSSSGAGPRIPLPPAAGSRRGGAGIRDSVLRIIRENPAGLSRREILERLHVKGDKTGETGVSNALTALINRQEIVRRERKYLIE